MGCTQLRDVSVSPPIPALARLRDRGRPHFAEICDRHRDRAAASREEFGFSRRSGDADLWEAALSEALPKIERHFDGTPIELATQARPRTMT